MELSWDIYYTCLVCNICFPCPWSFHGTFSHVVAAGARKSLRMTLGEEEVSDQGHAHLQLRLVVTALTKDGLLFDLENKAGVARVVEGNNKMMDALMA